MLYYIYFIICIIEVFNVVALLNENDIINELSKSSGIVTLNINSKIDITKEIKISSLIQKLYITGSSLVSAKLNFKYPLNFDSNIEEVEIKNINIDGNIFFKKNNKKIILDTVNLYGYIDSDFDKNSNNNIEIKNFNYKPTGESVENCINLSGNIKINKSNFFGNSSCRNRLLNYNGFKKYRLDLYDSYFNGEYECPFLSIENALYTNIEASYFEKGYSSRDIDGGAGMVAIFSNIYIKNCTFNDILSHHDGGAFNLQNNYIVEGSNLNFNNVTSLGLGSIFQISSFDISKVYLNNITQYNTGNVKNMKGGGLIMNIEGEAEVNINTYHAENLINNETSGSAIILTDNVKLIIKNMYVKNLIGNGRDDGLFYTSHDSLNIQFNAYNITLYDLYQINKLETSIFYFERNNFPIIDGLKIFNSGGYNTNLINLFENSIIALSNLEVDYFESKTNRELVNFETPKLYYRDGQSILKQNTISYCKISNIISGGALFRIQQTSFNITNCDFQKIHECYKYNNCTNINNDKIHVQDAAFIIAYDDALSGANFSYINIDQMYGDIGILLYTEKIEIRYGTVSNSYFKNGFLHWDEREHAGGIFRAESSIFENNTSEYGTIFNVPYTGLSADSTTLITVANCTFNNNTASKFGGVIYSIGEYNAKRMAFSGCYYNNNHAQSGNIIYGHSRNTIQGIGQILMNFDDVSTIPAKFEMIGDKYDEIIIFSGDSIPNDIMFKMYDDFGNQMYFPQESSNLQYEDLVLFSLEVNDTYNTKVLGQNKDYCWNEVCKLPPVKVIGNPGIYTLSLKFKSFGSHKNFAKDTIDIPLEIRKCKESKYINQAIDNTHLKSCYLPKCEYNCNNRGSCVNNNVCNCTDNYVGKFCNEYIKLERYPTLDTVLIIIVLVIIFVLIVLIGMTIHFKSNSIIKGGGFEFLIIILIGLIINSVNAIFLTFKKSPHFCYQSYLFSNTGFSFVFGSIFVKTYRIYKIFCQKKRFKIGLRKSIMYTIIILMTSFHWMMAIIWFIFKKITVENGYTGDNKEFIYCKYPLSKNISSLFNFLILMLEFVLSYAIRKVEKKYKEALVIPAYTYIVYMLLMHIIENQKVINVVMRDYFDMITTILNILVSIYDLFIIKFIEILTENGNTNLRIKFRNRYKRVQSDNIVK